MKNHDAITDGVCGIIADVLELDAATLGPETYVFRDLDTESIDLLEYGIGMSRLFGVRVQDSVAFLKDFRVHATQADGSAMVPDAARVASLQTRYPHLTETRIAGMIQELAADTTARPVLQIKDIAAYIRYLQRGA